MNRKLEVVVINTDEDIQRHRIDRMPCSLPCPRCNKVFDCLEDAQLYFETCKRCYEYTKPPARNKKSAPRKKRSK